MSVTIDDVKKMKVQVAYVQRPALPLPHRKAHKILQELHTSIDEGVLCQRTLSRTKNTEMNVHSTQ